MTNERLKACAYALLRVEGYVVDMDFILTATTEELALLYKIRASFNQLDRDDKAIVTKIVESLDKMQCMV